MRVNGCTVALLPGRRVGERGVGRSRLPGSEGLGTEEAGGLWGDPQVLAFLPTYAD